MMPEFPRELIRQVQISTRSAAGLSRYDPSDPTPPTPPSISDAIADLELSPTQLRCEHCKGGLLRGLLSNICVYCGARCRADVTPEPIFFNSTIGYRWLLRSLNLDGSEIVKPLTNKNDQDQGQSSQKPDIPLSDFLNFRIALSSKKEKQDRIASGQRSEENKGFSHLDRVAPDNFFFRSTGDSKQVGATRVKEVTALENQNLFQGIQSSVPAARGNIDKPVDEFSGWEADFQSGASENQHGISTFSDDFVGGSDDSQESTRDSKLSHLTNVELDLSSHFDSVFGDKNNVLQGKPTDHVVASPAWDLASEDVLPRTNSNESQLDEGFNVTEKSNDLNISADIFQEFELPNNNTDMLGSQIMTGDKDESLEVKVSDKLSITEDNHMVEISAEAPSVDLFKDFQWQTNGAEIVTDRRTNEEQGSINQSHDEDFFDASADSHSTEVNLFQDFKWQTDDDDKKVNNLQASVSVESFDEWNDFTGSTGLQDPFAFAGLQNDDNLFIHQQESSDVDLFSPNAKLEDGNLISSFQPPFAPTAGFDDIFSNNPSNRLSDGSGKPTTTGDEVKMLISQMDDLSFMLKSDLCIPPASNSDKPSTKDR